MQPMRRRGLLLALVLIAMCLRAAPAFAQADLYKGKTVTIVVGYSSGGGFDLNARMLARYIGKHIPGAPQIVVQNMPGAASLRAVRYLDGGAPTDGTTLAMLDPGLVTDSIITPDQVSVHFTDYWWIGAIMRDLRVCYASSAIGVRSWDDVMRRSELILGATAKGATAYKQGALLRNMLKAPIRQVLGYPGSNDQRLALERGEIEGLCASWSAVPDEWVKDGKIVALVKFGTGSGMGLPASVPYVGDLAKTQDDKDVVAILGASGELGRPFIVSRRVPTEAVAILRAAFDATMRDSGFLGEAGKQSLPVEPTSGAEAQKLVERLYAAPSSVAARARAMTE